MDITQRAESPLDASLGAGWHHAGASGATLLHLRGGISARRLISPATALIAYRVIVIASALYIALSLSRKRKA